MGFGKEKNLRENIHISKGEGVCPRRRKGLEQGVIPTASYLVFAAVEALWPWPSRPQDRAGVGGVVSGCLYKPQVMSVGSIQGFIQQILN